MAARDEMVAHVALLLAWSEQLLDDDPVWAAVAAACEGLRPFLGVADSRSRQAAMADRVARWVASYARIGRPHGPVLVAQTLVVLDRELEALRAAHAKRVAGGRSVDARGRAHLAALEELNAALVALDRVLGGTAADAAAADILHEVLAAGGM